MLFGLNDPPNFHQHLIDAVARQLHWILVRVGHSPVNRFRDVDLAKRIIGSNSG